MSLRHPRKLVMEAVNQVAQAVDRAADVAGDGRETLVPDAHGHIEIRQLITRAPGH